MSYSPDQKDFELVAQCTGIDVALVPAIHNAWQQGKIREHERWRDAVDVFESWPEIFGTVSSDGIIIIVCGGRKYKDTAFVNGRLDWVNENYGPIKRVVHGGATGADTRALEWALARGINHRPYRPDWTAHGRAAGPIRNAKMLKDEQPDFVVAFPGGPGTADMTRKAKKAGVTVLEFNPTQTESNIWSI